MVDESHYHGPESIDMANIDMRIETTPGVDGRPLKFRRWSHAAPTCRVVMVHGVISHGGWYVESGRRLQASGCEVDFLDRRGSGLNHDHRGDVDRYETWIDDLAAHVQRVTKQSPDVPIALVGISWGGKLACEFVRRHPEHIASLALICPGLFARQFPSRSKYAVLSALARIGCGGVRVPIPLRDPSLFTDVPSWQSFIRRDPDTLRRVTIRFAMADRELTHAARQNPNQINVPTWLALAGRDRIIENKPTREYVDQIENGKRLVTMYPDAAHTFEFEPDPTKYFDDLVRWVTETQASTNPMT